MAAVEQNMPLDLMEQMAAVEQNMRLEALPVEKAGRLEEEEVQAQEVAGAAEDGVETRNGGCPPGWAPYVYRYKCYRFFSSPKTWVQAEKHCLNLGGNLASLHSVEEHKFITDLVWGSSGDFPITWIGGHDAVQDRMWFWSDGSRFDYQLWHTGQPNNAGGSGIVLNYSGEGSNWYDISFGGSYPFVCARPNY